MFLVQVNGLNKVGVSKCMKTVRQWLSVVRLGSSVGATQLQDSRAAHGEFAVNGH